MYFVVVVGLQVNVAPFQEGLLIIRPDLSSGKMAPRAQTANLSRLFTVHHLDPPFGFGPRGNHLRSWSVMQVRNYMLLKPMGPGPPLHQCSGCEDGLTRKLEVHPGIGSPAFQM